MKIRASTVRHHTDPSDFAVAPDGRSFAWLRRRGRVDAAPDDSGVDLMLGAGECLVEAVPALTGGPCFLDAARVATQEGRRLVARRIDDPALRATTLLEIGPDERFAGSPRAAGCVVVRAGCPRLVRDGVCVFRGPPGSHIRSFDAHGPVVAVACTFANAMRARVFRVETVEGEAGGEPTLLAEADFCEYAAPQVAVLANGDVVARLVAPEVDRAVLTKFVADGGAPVALVHERGLELGPIVATADRAAVFTTVRRDPQRSTADVPALVHLDGRVQIVEAPGCADPGVHTPVAVAPDGEAFFVHASPRCWGDLWSGSRGALTTTMPRSVAAGLAMPREVVLPGEHPVHCLVYLPAETETETETETGGAVEDPTALPRDPAALHPIVWVRGGPMVCSRVSYAPFHQWLANQGYAVVAPNYAGSTGFGLAHMRRVWGAGVGREDVGDVERVGRALRERPELFVPGESGFALDLSGGVGLGGRSWGGYVALCAATAEAPESAFSCFVAGSGITDWAVQQAATDVRYYDYALLGGWLRDQRARASERSPLTRAAALRRPMLLYHGADDVDVPFKQIPPFVAAARAAGAPLEYVEYAGEGHSNRDPANQVDILRRISDFYRVNLKPWDFVSNPHGEVTAY